MPALNLATLNDEQRLAVVHGTNDPTPLLIIAGAGSGKTNTLAYRVAHLIAENADPRRIMLLTFSRRAATEMTRRVERIAIICGVHVPTPHSVAAQMFRSVAVPQKRCDTAAKTRRRTSAARPE
jgi:superfamily I DNA/RNA helicase